MRSKEHRVSMRSLMLIKLQNYPPKLSNQMRQRREAKFHIGSFKHGIEGKR